MPSPEKQADHPWRICLLFLLAMGSIVLPGCSKEAAPDTDSLVAVNLQTDWFAQPEQGGFYQALAKGYYKEEGLEVNILPGGPNAMSVQKILKGDVQFAMNRADTIYGLATREVPILMVMSTLQHDPQALMLHASNPIQHLQELEGATIMAVPGLMWIRWLEAQYNIHLKIIPHDFGMERFLNDPAFIQQCLLTNEPYYAHQAGVAVKVLPLSESGFDPYHGVYCLRAYAEEHPDVVRRFVAASIRGWQDYITNDPSPALDLIEQRNPRMNVDFMRYSYDMLRDKQLITGSDISGNDIGDLDDRRMQDLTSQMSRLGLVPGKREGADPAWYTRQFLVTPLDEPSGGLP